MAATCLLDEARPARASSFPDPGTSKARASGPCSYRTFARKQTGAVAHRVGSYSDSR